MQHPHVLFFAIVFMFGSVALGADPEPKGNPADNLPPHITRMTWFGERADWSHEGRKILFLSKTFGDAMEYDLDAKVIRNLTAHYRRLAPAHAHRLDPCGG